MKIHVLYDKEGNIISGGVPLPPAYDFQGPKFGPIVQEGQHAAELDVPEEYTGLGLAELAQRLRVDTRGRPHKLTSK